MRIILGTTLFTMLCVTTLYSSNLMATLTTRKIKPPFNSLEGLAKDTKYNIYTASEGNALVQILHVGITINGLILYQLRGTSFSLKTIRLIFGAVHNYHHYQEHTKRTLHG